ncbi:hypothetical protein DMC30DRAFT_436090, partial [Rhodotorula diobovata]
QDAPEQHLIILAGVVGSGKSTLSSAWERLVPNWVRVNQDDLGDRRACEHAVRAALRQGKSVLVDRQNFDAQQRRTWLEIAAEFPQVKVGGMVLGTTTEECRERLLVRQDHPTIDNPRLAVQLLDKFTSLWEEPQLSEGYDHLITLPPLPPPPSYTPSLILSLLALLAASPPQPRRTHPAAAPPARAHHRNRRCLHEGRSRAGRVRRRRDVAPRGAPAAAAAAAAPARVGLARARRGRRRLGRHTHRRWVGAPGGGGRAPRAGDARAVAGLGLGLGRGRGRGSRSRSRSDAVGRRRGADAVGLRGRACARAWNGAGGHASRLRRRTGRASCPAGGACIGVCTRRSRSRRVGAPSWRCCAGTCRWQCPRGRGGRGGAVAWPGKGFGAGVELDGRVGHAVVVGSPGPGPENER